MMFKQRGAAFGLAAVLAVGAVWAQPTAIPEEAAPAVDPAIKWMQGQFSDAAQKYEFFHDTDHVEPLTLVDHAVFHWKQDDDWHGDLFIWNWKGRPEILGCILASNPSGQSRNVFHEFHALTEAPLSPQDLRGTRWSPREGTPRLTLPEAPRPAASAPLRLSQLRTQARRFAVTMRVDAQPWELRMLPQPIYRYSAPDADVIDGALFTFVWTKGTDPEFVLLLECDAKDTKAPWKYSPVRMTNRELSLRLADEPVWNCGIAGDSAETEPYTTSYAESVTVPSP